MALAHPEWDLSTFSGAESNFWDVEPSAAEEGAPAGGVVETGAAKKRLGRLRLPERELERQRIPM